MTCVTMRAAHTRALPSAATGGTGLFGRLGAAVRRHLDRQRSRRELEALPDELLKDIGITRCDIAGIIEGRVDATRRYPLQRGRQIRTSS